MEPRRPSGKKLSGIERVDSPTISISVGKKDVPAETLVPSLDFAPDAGDALRQRMKRRSEQPEQIAATQEDFGRALAASTHQEFVAALENRDFIGLSDQQLDQLITKGKELGVTRANRDWFRLNSEQGGRKIAKEKAAEDDIRNRVMAGPRPKRGGDRAVAERGVPKAEFPKEHSFSMVMEAIRQRNKNQANDLLPRILAEELSDKQLQDIVTQFTHAFPPRQRFNLEGDVSLDVMPGYPITRFFEELKRREGDQRRIASSAPTQRIERPSAAVENVFAPPASERQASRVRDSQKTNPSEDTSLFARARRWLGF